MRESDPRYQRVRRQLIGAIAELAAIKPAEEITVSELAVQAGIARTTFYTHADSPAQFLADYLIDEVRPILERFVTLLDDADEDYLLRWRDIVVELLEHVRANRSVYTHIFTVDGQSVVLAMMSAYFEKVFAQYVESFVDLVEGDEPSELWTAMATSQQVHNLIVVISAWLRTGMTESAESVIGAYITLAPPWQLARFNASGRTSLPRHRIMNAMFDRIVRDDEESRS